MDKAIKKQAGSSDRDAALIRKIQAGDMAASDQLVIKHKDKLFIMVYWFLGDYQQANDCAQEIFLKVFRSIKSSGSSRHFPHGFIELQSIFVKINLNLPRTGGKKGRFLSKIRIVQKRATVHMKYRMAPRLPNKGAKKKNEFEHCMLQELKKLHFQASKRGNKSIVLITFVLK